MRIKLLFAPSVTKVPINAQASMAKSYIHTCLGRNNDYHGNTNNISISMVCGGLLNEDRISLSYPTGAYIIVSSFDGKFIGEILNGISKQRNVELGYGMKYSGYEFIHEKFNNGWNNFATLTPALFIKNDKAQGREKHLLLDEQDFEVKLREYLFNKLTKINQQSNLNLNLSYFDVQVPKHDAHKIKRIYVDRNVNGRVHTVKNYANKFHFNIRCDKNVAEFLYSIGIGKSTQNGFGTIINAENLSLY